MGTDLLLIVATSFSAIALGVSIVSLSIHWSRRNEHPDVTQLRTDVIDVLDKVEHWIKRDRVRRLRAAREPEEEAPQETGPITKDQLRARLRTLQAARQ